MDSSAPALRPALTNPSCWSYIRAGSEAFGGAICNFFFFSSRRRHTRYWRDWSSDVCSSDLYLIEHGGYRKGNPEEFDRNLALNKNIVLAFLQETQPKAWEKLQKTHGKEIETKVIQRLYKELELRGMLDVLRSGFTDYGVKFVMAYFKSETSLNPETIRLY